MSTQRQWSEVKQGDIIDIEGDIGNIASYEGAKVLEIEHDGLMRCFFEDGSMIKQENWIVSKIY